MLLQLQSSHVYFCKKHGICKEMFKRTEMHLLSGPILQKEVFPMKY